MTITGCVCGWAVNEFVVSGVNDASEWELTLASLDKLNFSAADVQAMQRVLSLVLHLV